MGQESKWGKGQDGLSLVYPPDGTIVKIGQESRWAKSQDGPRVKGGHCCLFPERVELTVNSKKEMNGRAKMGQKSKWATPVYSPKEAN